MFLRSVGTELEHLFGYFIGDESDKRAALITVVGVVVHFLHQFGEGKAGAGESPVSPEERGVGGMDFDHQSHGLGPVHDMLCTG